MITQLGNKKIMSANILHYMNLKGKTRKDMCEALDVKYTTFTDWVNANTYPRIDKIEKMANYFGIEKSDLIEDHSELNKGVFSGIDTEQQSVFTENLNRYIRASGKTQADIAKAIGVSAQTFNTWVKGIAIPRMGKIQRLADYFNVGKTDLIDPHQQVEKSGNMVREPECDYTKRVTSVRIPVTGMIHAGIPADAVEDIIDWEDITPDIARRGEIIALQVKGDCMEPKISDKDVVIVLQQSDCNSGDTVVAMVNSEEAMLRVLKKFEDGSINLVPTNPSYPVERFSPDEVQKLPVRIIGKVIELRAKF